jgi:hypothetical protein
LRQIHDFAINEFPSNKEGAVHSLAVVSKKKEGYIIFLNPTTKKFEESKKFSLNELPTNLGYSGSHIVCSYKKDYETYNVEKNFALAKGPIQPKFPYFKVTGSSEVVFFMDDVGLFMDPQFMPKQKDNITLVYNKPVLDIGISGNYCLILCEGILQIYTICNSLPTQSTPRSSPSCRKYSSPPPSAASPPTAPSSTARTNSSSSTRYPTKRRSSPSSRGAGWRKPWPC